ncbi:MAG: hypothetical protein AAF676_08795, partial [Pseudomonadota bacterium]
MAVITVTSGRFDGGEGLSLREAIEQAMATPEADVIRFSASLAGAASQGALQAFEMPGGVEIIAAGGALTIDGDVDGDGLTDILIDADEGRHFTVQTGAELTLRNLDLVSSSDRPGRAEDGARGEDGQFADAVEGNDGQDGVNAFFDEIQDAGDGQEGAAGDIAAASILNFGTLTLERVGFGGNGATGGLGGEGGRGGSGASGQRGTDGLDGQATGKFAAEAFGSFFFTDFDFDENDPGDLPSNFSNGFATTPIAGGRGGEGADGGQGGDGGAGGKGGDAGIVVNGETGRLEMKDVVFGGVLTSGWIGEGNPAFGGDGHRGGQGGGGGSGGSGGDGGDGTFTWFTSNVVTAIEDDDNWQAAYIRNYVSAPGGEGGLGGNGGGSGRPGDSGDGGDAGMVVNLGVLTGEAAFTSSSGGEGGGDTPFNRVEEGEGNRFSLALSAFAGSAGRSDGGRQLLASWQAWGTAVTKSPSLRAVDFSLEDDMETNTRYPRDVWSGFDSILGTPANIPSDREKNWPFREDAAENPGQDGLRPEEPAEHGEAGDASLGIVGDGASDARSAPSLVYVHDMGVRDGALTFNIIRVGQAAQEATVSWRVSGPGENGVSASDFSAGTALTGSVTFDAVALTPSDDLGTARGAVSRIVTLNLIEDGRAEGTEGYRIQLQDLSGAGAELGTASVTGTVTDADESGSGGGGGGETPPRATNGRDRFSGDGGRDRYDGKGGNDVISGKGGRDVLNGGNGKDRIDGGRGNDVIDGDRGNDRLKGGAGRDDFRFARGDGKDVITDFRLNQDDIQIR